VSVSSEVQKLKKRYPDPLSAVMPALQVAQAENGGWLSADAIREVADALELTPAYCLSIASFYDQYYLEPVGRTHVEVCTNVSCGLAGAQQVVEAFERELGISAGSTSEDGAFTLGTIECLGGCGWATVVAVNNRHRLRVQAEDVPGSSRSSVAEHPSIVFAGTTDGGSVLDIGEYEKAGGFKALRKARAMSPDEVIAELTRRAPRARGRVLPDRAQVVVRPEARPAPKPHYLVVNADESEPGRSRTARSCCASRSASSRAASSPAHGIESQHVFIYIRGSTSASSRCCATRSRRCERPTSSGV
jgi:NADH:ubiquinone oxidoreductase subunit E